MDSRTVGWEEHELEVMDHLLHIESSLEAMRQDIADIKASMDRIVVQCACAHAMLVQMGRDIERVH